MAAAERNATACEIVRLFSGKRQSACGLLEQVASAESQAALRQFSVERLMGYGVHHADAMELRGRVWSGEDWQAVSTELAQTCLSPPERSVSPETSQTRANRLFRASALLRMSQVMMIRNSSERSAIYARAGRLYEEAAALLGDRQRLTIETPNGPLTGWLHRSKSSPPIGFVVVIGGIEGWAMDFGDMGAALAARGMEALLLDGPGQGESRMIHGQVLTLGWEDSYYAVFDALERRDPGLPIGFIGNSMGGALAMHLAARDARIVACCDNGGTPDPGRPRDNMTFTQKMASHCGDVALDASATVWRSVMPVHPEFPVRCPLLVVHGGLDPLVSTDHAKIMSGAGLAEDKHLIIFSDGDHCVYNHADDKHDLIGDWMAARLGAAARTVDLDVSSPANAS